MPTKSFPTKSLFQFLGKYLERNVLAQKKADHSSFRKNMALLKPFNLQYSKTFVEVTRCRFTTFYRSEYSYGRLWKNTVDFEKIDFFKFRLRNDINLKLFLAI